MIYPFSYITFLFHFHGDRDYFECHEVLEEHWKKSGMMRDSVWVGLIQAAVSFYHYRRGNFRGAIKLMSRAIGILANKRARVHALGLHHAELIDMLQESLERMKKRKPYTAILLPVRDTELLAVCKERLRTHGHQWGSADMMDERIVHKHLIAHSQNSGEKSFYKQKQKLRAIRKNADAFFLGS